MDERGSQMTSWQWECFDKLATPDLFTITEPGPLHTPIRSFSVSRDDKLQLILRTVADGEARSTASPPPAGTIRRVTETIKFSGSHGFDGIAHGVLPRHRKRTWNGDASTQTEEYATLQSIIIQSKRDVETAYTIDWLVNVDTEGHFWRGTSVDDKQRTTYSRVIGTGEHRIEFSSKHRQSNLSTTALEICIDNLRLFLCIADGNVSKKHKTAAYILYEGAPSSTERKSIRQALSFVIGRCLIYLGCTTLCDESQLISTEACSAHTFGGRIFEIVSLPPAPLGMDYDNELNQEVFSTMVPAILSTYDELRFDNLSWAYWYALCAPLHIAAAHFGAAIELLQNAYVEHHSTRFERKIIEDARSWQDLQDGFLKVLQESNLEQAKAAVFKNKILSLNTAPRSLLSDKVFSQLGLNLSKAEREAWSRRNKAAHGARIKEDETLDMLISVKLLRIMLCRLVLRISKASEYYIDYATLGLPIRKVVDPASP